MDLQAVRVFLAVAERSRFGKAGKALGVSQSAVSQTIRELESEFGVRLFERDKSGARLTPAGETFREHALQIVRVTENAEHTLKTWRGIKGRWLRVGHSPAQRELAVAGITKLLAEKAGLRVTVEEAISPQVRARVRQGELDVGIIHARTLPENVASFKLGDTLLRLAVHPKHGLAKNRAVELGALTEARFVLTRGDFQSRKTVRDYFAEHDFVPTIAMEANTMATVLAAVRGSAELATVMPVPAPQVAPMQGLVFVDLIPTCRTESSYMIWNGSDKKEPDAEPARWFRRSLSEILGLPHQAIG